MSDHYLPRHTSARIHAQRRYCERTGRTLTECEYRAMVEWARTAPVAGRDPSGRELVRVGFPDLELFAVFDRRLDRIVTFLPKMEIRHAIAPPGETAMAAAFARAQQHKRSIPDDAREG